MRRNGTLLARKSRQYPSMTLFCPGRTIASIPSHLFHVQYSSSFSSQTYRALPDQATTAKTTTANPSPSVPWYMRSTPASETKTEVELPALPDDAPSSLPKLCKFMLQDLGLEDVTILDLRGKTFTNNPFGANAIMVICSGKSHRHLSKAAREMTSWLKQENHRCGYAEGILSSNMLRVHQRRLKKKTQKKSKYVQANDEFGSGFNIEDPSADIAGFKKVSSWVALDTKLDGIFVHLFSGSKRQEVDLESFWLNSKERELILTPEITDSYRAEPNRFERMYKVPSRGYSTLSSSIRTSSHISSTYSTIAGAPPVPRDATIAQLKSHINYLSNLNAHDNLNKEKLSLDSPVVKEMLAVFPSEATAEHWYLRLLLISELRYLNPEQLPLKAVVDLLLYQQASGIPISQWQVEFAVKRIAYDSHGIDTFKHSQPDFKTLSKWEAYCKEKLELVIQIHDIAFRATGEKMSTNNSIMAMLLRLLVAPGVESFTPEQALENPTPLSSTPVDINTGHQFGRTFVDNRAVSLIEILDPTLLSSKKSTETKHLNKPTVALILTSMVNGGLWTEFWVFWTRLTRAANLDADITALMVSLVAKSGSETAVSLLVDKYLPEYFLSNGTDTISTGMLNALNNCLDYLDPEKRSYDGLREFIRVSNEKLSIEKLSTE